MSDWYISLTFIPMPVYVQYKAEGKGEDYTAEFTILTAEEFAQKVAECFGNDLTIPEGNELEADE